MLDIDLWLDKINVDHTAIQYLSPPNMPYIVYLDEQNWRGSDNKNNICERSITLELYTENIDKDIEKIIENLFDESGYKYYKNSVYIKEGLNAYQTIYKFDIIEKV